MKKFSLGIILIVLTNMLLAQDIRINWDELGLFGSTSGAKVTITEDTKLKTIMDNRLKANPSKQYMGWRVQIFFGSGNSAKAAAEKVQRDFLAKYPNVESYILYESPYFKVRVGDFRTRLEAAKLKKELQNMFTYIFLVEEPINLPKL